MTYRTCVKSPPDALKPKDLDLTWCYKKPEYKATKVENKIEVTAKVTVSNICVQFDFLQKLAILYSTKCFQAEDFVCNSDNCNNRTINRKDCADYPNGGIETIKIFQSHVVAFGILFVTAATNICKYCL